MIDKDTEAQRGSLAYIRRREKGGWREGGVRREGEGGRGERREGGTPEPHFCRDLLTCLEAGSHMIHERPARLPTSACATAHYHPGWAPRWGKGWWLISHVTQEPFPNIHNSVQRPRNPQEGLPALCLQG